MIATLERAIEVLPHAGALRGMSEST